MSHSVRVLLCLATTLGCAIPALAQGINPAIQAYAWADNSNAASYTPDPNYSFSTSGGAITATRSGTGRYQMTFAGVDGVGGNVQVSAYGSNAICSVDTWDGSTSVVIAITCINPATLGFVDTAYTVLFTRRLALPARVRYAWANDKTADSYAPDPIYAFNSGQPITVTRSEIGTYVVTFDGVDDALANAGDVQVSAYGTSSRCVVGGWGANGTGGLEVYVQCYAGGSLNDTRFTVLFVEGGGAASRGAGYAWADNPTAASYTPSSSYAYANGGGAIAATRSDIGRYAVMFSGLGSNGGDSGGHIQVTAYGGSAVCTSQGWGSFGADVSAAVFCYDGAGAPVDSRFDLLFLRPDLVATAADSEPADGSLALDLAGSNPSRNRVDLAVTLASSADARLAVYDALGREVAVLVNGALPGGTTRLGLDTSALPAGVYIVRLTAGGAVRTQTVTVVR